MELQSKLLRVLQEGQYERVGEDRTRQANVRIIAATNRDMNQEVDAGKFRQDLYYRLSVFPIEVPPLRQRIEDIPLLASHFFDRASKRLNCTRVRLTQTNLRQLQNYSWPGNVRELQNVIERATIISQTGPLRLDLALPVNAPESASAPGANKKGETDLQDDFVSEKEWKTRERDNILAALKKSGGRIYGPGGAAELLGVRPTTFAYRLKALGIKKPRVG